MFAASRLKMPVMHAGGALYIGKGGLLQEGGFIEIHVADAGDMGGGILAHGSLRQLAGNLSCKNCSAKAGRASCCHAFEHNVDVIPAVWV